jgi:hypothetical protein
VGKAREPLGVAHLDGFDTRAAQLIERNARAAIVPHRKGIIPGEVRSRSAATPQTSMLLVAPMGTPSRSQNYPRRAPRGNGPRATVFTGGRGVRLRKFLEQPTHLLFGHADAGVGNCDIAATRAAPCPWGQRWWSRNLPGNPAPRGTAVRSKNDLDVKEIVNLWAGASAAVKSMLGRH